MRHSIAGQRRRIAEAEKEIAGLETGIAEAEKCIEELEKRRASLSQ
jgi:septal ring factor EnvC (AmiA/AmiB activator)